MKKIDSILKKATFFEKLAVYGDRSSFLRAMAQTSALAPEMTKRLDQLIKDVAPFDSKLSDKLVPFFSGEKSNLRELLPIVNESAQKIPRATNGPQRDNADQLAEMLGATPREQGIMNMPEGDPEDVITNQVMKFSPDKMLMNKMQMSAIPMDVRKALKELGYTDPINTAAEGQKALDWFREQNVLPPAITGQTLYNEIRNELKRKQTPHVAEL